MARLLIHVEGQTEESFVNEVLRGHLVSKGYDAVSVSFRQACTSGKISGIQPAERRASVSR
jgi:hypothetical protein